MEKTICELFAGVGGFRLGFERLNSGWKTTWFSQWEPNAKMQWAHSCYVKHFGDLPDLSNEFNTNKDISLVDKNLIPNHNLLVGGFPCQDYSVAQNLVSSKGIEGKKGILWWEIRNTLKAKKPAFCLLENVDRLLKSPAKQRGRDFGIILSCFAKLGYNVEWRIINAAQYGAAQRRRRIFVFAYKKNTNYNELITKNTPEKIIFEKGLMVKSFPIQKNNKLTKTKILLNPLKVSNNFSFTFENSGCMIDKKIFTSKIIENEEVPISLFDILEQDVDKKYYLPKNKLKKIIYLKNAKKIERISKNGHKYSFSEGSIEFPDSLEKPGRTMLTSESTLSRSTHVILDPMVKKFRFLTPVETERLQGFDDNWTNTGMTDRMRYFCMGNALVVPMITRMGKVLDEIVRLEK